MRRDGAHDGLRKVKGERVVAERNVKGEFSDVKHVRGTLSMARFDDPDSATTSFSVLQIFSKDLQ